MQHEASIIKAFLKHETWEKYNTYLTAKDFPDDLQFLYRCLDSFHKTNESSEDLHLIDLANLFFAQHKKDKEFYQGVFDTLAEYQPNETAVRELVVSLKKSRLLRDLSITAYEVAEGKKEFAEVEKLMGSFDVGIVTEEEDDFVSDDLDTILNATYRSPGLKWRLPELNKSLGSLRKGDFGFVFARAETGKTTFLASEVTYMAEQVDGPVLFFNNEEVSEKVMVRLYQAALGCSSERLMASPEKCKAEYDQRLGGKILMPRGIVTSKTEIERLCKQHQPGLIIIDVIDKITGFKADRDDLMLGAIYQWARELAKQYAPVIAVCQADGSAEGVKWLTMNNVANAKTSKQAEADWILGIGKTHAEGMELVRYLNISKNKLAGDAGVTKQELRHGKFEVLIDPIHARYRSM